MTDTSISTKAVAAALSQNWKEAILLNLEILREQEENFEALSRLAYAYMRSGELSKAKKTYEHVLKIDKYNQIAQKNLKKLTNLKKDAVLAESDKTVSPLMFLEEPGKTKVVDCTHVAPNQVLFTLTSGEEVMMKQKNHCIEIRSSSNGYLAALPDDISFKLSRLIEAGNTYQTIVKHIDKNTLKVLIRELSRGSKFASQPSFTSTTSYIPFAKGGSGLSSDDIPDMTPTGEDTEKHDAAQDADE